MVVFFVKSVNAGLSSDEVFDFRDVIAENSQYPPVRDMCTRRISSGEIVEIEDVPYQSLIVESDDEGDYWKLVCGGSIVTRQHVISAAHCFQAKNMKINYRVVAGTGNTFMVWNRRSKQDIKLRHKSSEIWREILDCFTHSHYRKTPQHDFAVLRGKIARYLQMVCLPYVSRERCAKLSGYILEEEQFCAGDWGKATCKV
ncbi:hypothetical protein PYW07_003190 [Mythimna separata]|uniref:Peptidase S1 domain-containing protein n=1 Tax=Mythimna separata TaxID=271217 RepID=A0AAD7YJ64_MYTSE|nr:hypothetical protein PYW07_003190 [Mythimna separata]